MSLLLQARRAAAAAEAEAAAAAEAARLEAERRAAAEAARRTPSTLRQFAKNPPSFRVASAIGFLLSLDPP